MANLRYWALFLTCFQLCLHDGRCLSNVTLFVNPPAIQHGENVTLICNYDLENDPLYSAKWYRGNHEFYRYSPMDNPPEKSFKYDWFNINVDLNYSNATQVTLRNVDFNIRGNISCEVTTDRRYKIDVAYDVLEVVMMPPNPPVIKVNKDRYSPGDRLTGNCTYAASKPPAKLRFLVNNRPVSMSETQLFQLPEGNFLNTISFDVDPLTPGDFIDEKLGVLEVTCTAHIGRFFKKPSTLRIGPKNGDPVPERVRSIGSARGATMSPNGYLILVTIVHLTLQDKSSIYRVLSAGRQNYF